MQFVLGYFGTLAATPEHLIHIKQTADSLLGKENYKWSVIGIGYHHQFQMCTMAIIMGGHARVGLEDNLFIERGGLAKSSAEQVEKLVRIARELGREIATPDEAREILNLKRKDKVNF